MYQCSNTPTASPLIELAVSSFVCFAQVVPLICDHSPVDQQNQSRLSSLVLEIIVQTHANMIDCELPTVKTTHLAYMAMLVLL